MRIAIVLFLLSSATALPQGAPTAVCVSLTPFHGGGIPSQTGISPYVVIPRRQNGLILVSVESTLGVPFRGIILQGRTLHGEVLGKRVWLDVTIV